MKLSVDPLGTGRYWNKAWSLIEGCTPVSAACDNCWASAAAHMRKGHPNLHISASNFGLTMPSGEWNGTVRMRYDLLDLPYRIKKPTVFAVWTDLFHEGVIDVFILSAFIAMSQSPQHRFLILTKRGSRMCMFMDKYHKAEILHNVWLGVTAEDQKTADERISLLLETPATKRFVSVEPMLGPVDITEFLSHSIQPDKPDSTGYITQGLDWIVCGGESGSRARPIRVEWVRSLRDQCKAAGVPFWFKSWGRYVPAGQVKGMLDGEIIREWPE